MRTDGLFPYRHTMLAATLMAVAVLVPTIAWYVSGSRDTARRARQLVDEAIAEVTERLEQDADRFGSRLATLLDRESIRPFYHYQNLYHDPRGVAQGLAVMPSPLSQGTADPLVGAHFQIDPNGTVSLPTVNERFPELSTEEGLARFCEVLGDLQNGLLLTSGDENRIAGAGEERVMVLDRADWEQIQQADAVYATLTGRPSVAAPPTAVSFNDAAASRDADSVVVRVGPLRWQTIVLGSGPSLAALREVVTPDGSLVQGFTIAAPAVVEWIGAGVGFSPVLLHTATEVSTPVGDTNWYLTTDGAESVRKAELSGRQITSEFRRIFGFGSAAALCAALAVVLIVAQTDRLARQRAGFAAAAAHELKTPLATLRLHSEMLADGLGDPDHSRSYAGRIAPEVRRLGRVVTNMLDLSRLERGVALADPSPGDLGTAVTDCVERLRPALLTAGLRVDLEVEPDLAEILFDADAVSQILDNLLDNAEKHTRTLTERKVRVTVSGTESGAAVTVADNGPGIPRRLRRHLFRPFTRHADQKTGLGLGLAIGRSLARAQGGELRLVDDDHGASFELVLPRA
jgi:signal transduction histidine kinase